ncbi:3-oxo-5-alpha-steroid 4-dehydrogenase-domain-containing protein [Chytridium lagenaria]|nr:3-oxo-5-alpha-steroid 4-dehydrogenase-domain-containing protein [Chytridium lagenaria]
MSSMTSTLDLDAAYDYCIQGIFTFGILFFFTLLFIKAPFGRFVSTTFGPTIPGKWGWIIFEVVPVIVFPASFLLNSKGSFNPVTIILTSSFLTHYLNRSIVYVLRAHSISPTSISVVLSAILFNIPNAFVNGYATSSQPSTRLSDPTLYLGLLIFLTGMFINISSDNTLFRLRAPNSTGIKVEKNGRVYRIPSGGMFNYVSCANYFGEILEWVGWAVASSNWAGAAFAFFTFTNLFPRALATHRWV